MSAFASPALNNTNFGGKLLVNTAIGAVASKLSGGSAQNGAMTAAFGFLFNMPMLMHRGIQIAPK